jgi:hypothetical protein
MPVEVALLDSADEAFAALGGRLEKEGNRPK